MKKFDKKLVNNAIFLFLDWLFVTLLNFVFWSVASKTLVKEQYGIISTSINLATLLSGIGLLGFNTTISKLLPEYLEKRQENKAKKIVSFSLESVLLSNIALMAAMLLASSTIASILKIPNSVVFITVINTFLVSLWMFFAAILSGIQNMKKITVTNLIGHIVKICVSIALIFLGFSYFGPLLGFMVGILVIVLLRIPFKFLTNVKKEVLDKKQIFFGFALPAFVSSLAWLVFTNGQHVLLTAIKNPSVTGVFTVAFLLTNPIVSIPNILAMSLFPIISQLSTNHNSKNSQKHLLNMVLRYALLFSVPAALFLILFSQHVILLFANPEYLSATSLFPLLAVSSIIYGIGVIFNQTVYSLGKPKVQRNIVLETVLVFFILAVPLTVFFSALGMCVAYLLSVSFLNFLSYKHIKKTLNTQLPWGSIKVILASGLLSFLFLYVFFHTAPNVIFAIISCILAGLVYFELLFLFKFFTKDDVLVLKLIIEKFPVFREQLMKLVNFLFATI